MPNARRGGKTCDIMKPEEVIVAVNIKRRKACKLYP